WQSLQEPLVIHDHFSVEHYFINMAIKNSGQDPSRVGRILARRARRSCGPLPASGAGSDLSFPRSVSCPDARVELAAGPHRVWSGRARAPRRIPLARLANLPSSNQASHGFAATD